MTGTKGRPASPAGLVEGWSRRSRKRPILFVCLDGVAFMLACASKLKHEPPYSKMCPYYYYYYQLCPYGSMLTAIATGDNHSCCCCCCCRSHYRQFRNIVVALLAESWWTTNTNFACHIQRTFSCSRQYKESSQARLRAYAIVLAARSRLTKLANRKTLETIFARCLSAIEKLFRLCARKSVGLLNRTSL